MNVWKIDTRQDENVFLECDEEEWEKLEHFASGDSMKDEWDSTLNLRRNKKKTNIEYSDALRHAASYFVLSERATELFKKYAQDVIECLEFKCSEGKYEIVNPIEFVDCLDMEKSQYKVFKGDKNTIQSYKQLCLKKEALEGKNLFRIYHLHKSIMACSDEFKSAIEAAQLIGFKFELLSDEIV